MGPLKMCTILALISSSVPSLETLQDNAVAATPITRVIRRETRT